jgi:hypothetical protein
LLVLVLAAGAAALWLRRRDLFWWASGTVALAWLASALGRYPLANRLWVFFAPIGLLLVAAAVDEVSRRARPRLAMLAPALAVLILAAPTLASTRHLLAPPGKQEIRPLLQHVRERYREGDTLYVYFGAVPATLYYAARGLGFPGPVVMEVWWNRRADLPLEAETLPGKGRVWVLFSHVRRSRGVDDEAATLERLDRFGTRLEQKRETGAVVYLYAL